MDSPIITQLFRQLFRHRTCQSVRSHSTLPYRIQGSRRARGHVLQHRRGASGRGTGLKDDSHWQQRVDAFPEDMTEEFNKYPMVTADQLRDRKSRPKRVKMLTRDFIEDSLYNPAYGYFSKQVVIFSPKGSFDFYNIQDDREFHRILGRKYTEFEDKLDEIEPNDARQLWHTPTELFSPYYGEAIARYLVANYKISQYPYHDLIIYEMGAGNGTLMLNVLDYIRNAEPDVYDRTKFKIIEISSNLASLQNRQLMKSANSRGHAAKVEIINKSIFDWNQLVPSPCYFIAMEVFDNFAHDALRYDLVTEQPLQGTVLIDGRGEFFDFYVPSLDPVASRYLRVRELATGGRYPHPLPSNPVLRHLKTHLPFMPNLSDPEYIPTRLMQFFDVLAKYFPAHRLVTSDFHTLPHTIKGINAPVVQTRYQRRTVPVTTPYVHQGYFDILFPTDFRVMENIYRALTGKLTHVMSHEDFMRRWAFVEETETRSGENPLLSWYKNASVMTTV